MPRPRFDRLPPERRTALLEAAAQEFGAHGFDDASLNRILERAGVSKGAAYYYFDDKEDLFLTVIRYYFDGLGIDSLFEQISSATAATFWDDMAEVYRRSFAVSKDLPWAFGVWRAAGELWRSRPTGVLAKFADEELGVVMRLLKHGQTLGVIRTDIPDDLMVAWARAVDDAHDRWVLDHWAELDRDAMRAAADRAVDGMRRLLGSTGGSA